MKLIEASAEFIPQEDLYKQVELAGRTCYKSQDKITEDSAKAFVDRMINSKHLAMLEHGTVYLYLSYKDYEETWVKYTENPYSKVIPKYNHTEGNPHNEIYFFDRYITTNYRVLAENGWLDDLRYLCEPTEFHEKRYTFKVNTSIGVSREFNRHRANSIAEQSTRFCNYSTGKFDNQVAFCIPAWLTLNPGMYELKHLTIDGISDTYVVGDGYLIPISNSSPENKFIMRRMSNEQDYLEDIKDGLKPQQARENLTLCTATEVVYTGFASDWKHFFDLRYFETTGAVHPNMLELTTKMKKVAEEANIWNDIMKY